MARQVTPARHAHSSAKRYIRRDRRAKGGAERVSQLPWSRADKDFEWQMLRTSITLIFISFLYIQCSERQSQPVNNSANLSQQESQTSAGLEKKECDFTSFKALKMNSLPAVMLVKPVYPSKAKEQKMTGTVRVKVVVDKKGNVVRACAVEGDVLLREAAEAAALKSKFNAGSLSSHQAERYDYGEFIISYNFVL
jgi:TonB family protein